VNASVLIPAIAVVLVGLFALLGQYLNARNDRAITLQELEILSKLRRNSTEAEELSALVSRRIARWHATKLGASALLSTMWYSLGAALIMLSLALVSASFIPGRDVGSFLQDQARFIALFFAAFAGVFLPAALIGWLAFGASFILALKDSYKDWKARRKARRQPGRQAPG